MVEALLISEQFVKDNCSISQNVAGQYITPSIREAQDVALRRVTGAALLTKLKELVRTGDIVLPANAAYKYALDEARYFLLYQTLTGICTKVAYKVTNMGVVQTSDDNVQPVDYDTMCAIRNDYQLKADSECRMFQEYLLLHRNKLPELSEHECGRLRANLKSSATSGLWLGGLRSNVITKI